MTHLRSRRGYLFAEAALRCRLLRKVVKSVGENETFKTCFSGAVQGLGEMLTYQGLPSKTLYMQALSTSGGFQEIDTYTCGQTVR